MLFQNNNIATPSKSRRANVFGSFLKKNKTKALLSPAGQMFLVLFLKRTMRSITGIGVVSAIYR
jgi:hypothetical protein